jgi:hypothetical protein
MIGGQITIPASADQTDNGRDNTDTGIYIDDSTGTVHIEGVFITGQSNVMFDGIDVNAPLATVQIENVRVANVWGSDTTEHADVVQTWGGFRTLRIDRLTANGDYQGLTIDPDLGAEGSVDIRDVDLTVDPPPAALAPGTVGGGHMIWLTTQANLCTSAASLRFSNVFVADTKPGLPPMNTVWPEAHPSNLPCAGSLDNTAVSWPQLPVASSVTLGSPPGGSFVPSGVAGDGYKSPGYVASLASSLAVTHPGVLSGRWIISKRHLVVLLLPHAGTRRYTLVGRRARTKERSVVCRLTGKGRARRVRCTLTLSSGTWRLTVQAHSATSVLAQATHAVRVR